MSSFNNSANGYRCRCRDCFECKPGDWPILDYGKMEYYELRTMKRENANPLLISLKEVEIEVKEAYLNRKDRFDKQAEKDMYKKLTVIGNLCRLLKEMDE